ncbi:MAG: Phage head-tail joining protein [Bacteroidetes bacterium ADurb.BinA104]|nr:MAG: Phage head-tail joining protein [Bacteroidetes bacterium ADurb.BinA104]
MLNAGSLNKRIEIQSKTSTADGLGGYSDVWATTKRAWAAIWPLSASDVIEGMKTSAQVTHRVRIRYQSGITSAMRIKFGSLYFSIIAPPINPNMANEYLDILCKETA